MVVIVYTWESSQQLSESTISEPIWNGNIPDPKSAIHHFGNVSRVIPRSIPEPRDYHSLTKRDECAYNVDTNVLTWYHSITLHYVTESFTLFGNISNASRIKFRYIVLIWKKCWTHNWSFTARPTIYERSVVLRTLSIDKIIVKTMI